MEQWRKRISKIAASFEANKAEISTAEKQTKSANKSLKTEVSYRKHAAVRTHKYKETIAC